MEGLICKKPLVATYYLVPKSAMSKSLVNEMDATNKTSVTGLTSLSVTNCLFSTRGLGESVLLLVRRMTSAHSGVQRRAQTVFVEYATYSRGERRNPTLKETIQVTFQDQGSAKTLVT